jgi:polyhydroxybutyrate depolymerase
VFLTEGLRKPTLLAAAAILLFHLLGSVAARADDDSYSVDGGTYRVVAPPGWDGKSALPLVLFLHGYGQTSAEIVATPDLPGAVTSLGALLVVPDGLNRAWSHAGGPRHDRDDIAFLRDVVADAKRRWPIDSSRVYASGFSIGASMAWDLACHAAEGFAAFLPVSGDFWEPYPEHCDSGPVNLRHVHGIADTTFPMTGRSLRGGQYTQGKLDTSWDILRAADGCKAEPDRLVDETVEAWEGKLACRMWSSCGSGRQLELCLHTDGHDMEPAFLHASLVWALQLNR